MRATIYEILGLAFLLGSAAFFWRTVEFLAQKDYVAGIIALVVGFIFPFDRLLDMMRTVVNITGDATVAVTVGKWEGELDEEVFRARATQ